MRKRSKYRPRPVCAQPHLLAMMGASKMGLDAVLHQAQDLRLSVEEVCNGQGQGSDWRTIFDAINVADQLCINRVANGKDAISSIMGVVVTVMDRQQATKTRALYQVEKDLLRDFAAEYAGLLSGLTEREYAQALVDVDARIRRILSTESAPSDVRVVEAAE